MAGEDMIIARQGELKRLYVAQKVLEKVVKQVEATEILLLSSRQIRRIVKQIRIEGERGIIRNHPNNDGLLGFENRGYRLRLYPELRCAPLRIQS